LTELGNGNGDWREVYSRYAPAMYRLAFRMLAREAEAWDAVHEVFRRLLERPSTFRGEAQPMTYLYRAVSNQCLNALRAQTKDAPCVESGEAWGADDHQRASEARFFLQRLAQQLDDRALQIASLHFLQGMTQEEIGSVVGLSRKWVAHELARVSELAKRLASESPLDGGQDG
jgi:RNA polymerase sigma-70 factor (ECF subfamily)